MYLNRGSFNLRRSRRDRLVYITLYIVGIIGLIYFWLQIEQGNIQRPGEATPTLTRSPASYGEEAEKQFSAGQLAEAVTAYEKAIQSDPKRIDYFIKKARIQVYAGEAAEAVKTAQDAILLDSKSSAAHAVLALALDWSSEYGAASDAALRAIQLDPNNALAHAYYAEVLVDMQRWSQARDAIRQALTLDPNSMDVYRVYGYYLESTGNYEEAIQQYQAALKINPNLGFLYMQAGKNFRILAGKISPQTLAEQQKQDQYFETAIQYFKRASAINPRDIGPYLSISRTYVQMGQYGAAAQYLEEALKLEPANAQVHGDLGKVHVKALNYESAIIELKCAIDGCSTKDDTVDDEEGAPELQIEPLTLNSTSLETFYIYSSILAALSTPEQPYCQRARPLFIQIQGWVQQNDPENTVIFQILEENENICQIADANATQAVLGGGTVTPQPTATLKP